MFLSNNLHIYMCWLYIITIMLNANKYGYIAQPNSNSNEEATKNLPTDKYHN